MENQQISRRDFLKAALGIGVAAGIGGGIGAEIGIKHGPDILEWGNKVMNKIKEGEPAFGLRVITEAEAKGYIARFEPPILDLFKDSLPLYDVKDGGYQEIGTDQAWVTYENLMFNVSRTHEDQTIYHFQAGDRQVNFAKVPFLSEDSKGKRHLDFEPTIIWPDGSPIEYAGERGIEWYNTFETLFSAGYTGIHIFLATLVSPDGWIKQVSNPSLTTGPDGQCCIAGGVFVKATNPQGQVEYLLLDSYTRTGSNYHDRNSQDKFIIKYSE